MYAKKESESKRIREDAAQIRTWYLVLFFVGKLYGSVSRSFVTPIQYNFHLQSRLEQYLELAVKTQDFLDIAPQQLAYLFSWVGGVRAVSPSCQSNISYEAQEIMSF